MTKSSEGSILKHIPEDLPLRPITRSLGPSGSRELLGAGFLCKSGYREDHTNYDPPQYSLVYVIHGRGEYVGRGGSHPLRGGDYFQRIPGERHTTRIDPESQWHECFLDFGPGLMAALIAMGLIKPGVPVGHVGVDSEWVDAFALLARELLTGPESGLPALLPRMLDLHRRLVQGRQASGQDAERRMLARACDELSSNLTLRLDLREWCTSHGWGYEAFRKAFHTAMGVAPGHYRIRCRIDAARGLLNASPYLTVAGVAEQLGYASAYEFSTQFKRYTGLFPSRCRG